MNPSVRRSVCWFACRHNYLKWREVSLPWSYLSSCLSLKLHTRLHFIAGSLWLQKRDQQKLPFKFVHHFTLHALLTVFFPSLCHTSLHLFGKNSIFLSKDNHGQLLMMRFAM